MAQEETNNYSTTEASATSELAAMLAHESSLDPAALVEPEVRLESERDNSPVSLAVVLPTVVLIAVILVAGLVFPMRFTHGVTSAFDWVITNLGWAFVLFGTVFVAFVLVIATSKFGRIRLGSQDEQPEFSTTSWIAMMFAAGMGIGLMFYGASEPLNFYLNAVPGHEPHEVGTALATAMFHWTLHPWAVYSIVGLAIGYSTFRLGRKQLISSTFVPLVGEKLVNGWFGKVVDVLAIVATVFGTACSLGLGALQIRAGLAASGLVTNPGMGLIVTIVCILTLAFLLSAISGVGRGIQMVSNANMVLAALLAIFVFIAGPTVVELNLLPTSISTYISQFFEMAGRTAASADGTAGSWLSSWTIFYWAWWISWSPFVGMFLARISRGRTIREFCLGVLLVPTLLSTMWFAIFGGTAITLEQRGQSITGDGSVEVQLFNLLHELPGGAIAGLLAVILLATFFITSADSASTVMGSMSQNGVSSANRGLTALWGLLTSAVGLTLLLTGGSKALNNVQNVTIVAATPFLVIIVGMMIAIVRDLRDDVIYLDQREQERFNRRLAIERRHVREREELRVVDDRRRRALRLARRKRLE